MENDGHTGRALKMLGKNIVAPPPKGKGLRKQRRQGEVAFEKGEILQKEAKQFAASGAGPKGEALYHKARKRR